MENIDSDNSNKDKKIIFRFTYWADQIECDTYEEAIKESFGAYNAYIDDENLLEDEFTFE